MATELKQHISLVSDNPLHAVLVGRNTKAYLVAQLAFINGVEAAAEHYRTSLGTIYAAMSFYEDNRKAIAQADAQALQNLWEMGMKDGTKEIARLRKRLEEKKRLENQQ
jgi:hypothetical protein